MLSKSANIVGAQAYSGCILCVYGSPYCGEEVIVDMVRSSSIKHGEEKILKEENNVTKTEGWEYNSKLKFGDSLNIREGRGSY